MAEFHLRTRIPYPAERVFAWHERRGAFERLAPPWQGVRVIERAPGRGRDGEPSPIGEGARVTLRVPGPPWPTRWQMQHAEYEADRQFVDLMRGGPFAHWRHAHRFEPDGPDACWMDDHVEYRLPLAPVSHWVAESFVRRQLWSVFPYRHRTLLGDLRLTDGDAQRPLRVLLTGATGSIGRPLAALLGTAGHHVTRLARPGSPEEPAPPWQDTVHWDPYRGEVDPALFAGYDAIVHLAGRNIAAGRWTEALKREIRESRVIPTQRLCDALARLETPPPTLICASAVGFYGDRDEALLTEQSVSGEGFLADVCRAWEAAAEPARKAGVRVAHLRFGAVLTPAAGALRTMLPAFGLGLGGPLGSGKAFLAWVSIDDALGAIHHVLTREDVHGPVNVVAPQPLRNREFARELGRALERPAFLPAPACALRAVLGEMADALLLAGMRVQPRVLIDGGYRFRQPDLCSAVRELTGREPAVVAADGGER